MQESQQSSERSPKDVYLETIKQRLAVLTSDNSIPQAFADGVIERVEMVEGPFEGTSHAEKVAKELIVSVVEPIVLFCRNLNNVEMQFLAIEGEVDMAIASVEKSKGKISNADKVLIDLREVKDGVAGFLEKIRQTRAGVV